VVVMDWIIQAENYRKRAG